jgi:hypothetical protein
VGRHRQVTRPFARCLEFFTPKFGIFRDSLVADGRHVRHPLAHPTAIPELLRRARRAERLAWREPKRAPPLGESIDGERHIRAAEPSIADPTKTDFMEKGPCMEPSFPCLPGALVNRYDQDHSESPHALQDSQSPHAASVSMTVQAIRAGARLMKLMRFLYKNRPNFQACDRLAPKATDAMIIATLLLLVAMAVLTAPRSTAEAYRELQALLLMQGTPEWVASAGAVGDQFSVSP